MVDSETLGEHYRQTIQSCERACLRAKRAPDEVGLIAVSKTVEPEIIRQAYELGQRRFGENRAQELAEKHPALPRDIEWHFIGRLQRNKVKYIINVAKMIHSVDSETLAEEISRQALRADKKMPVLVQMNLEEEETKAGFAEADLRRRLADIARLPGIAVCGLMTIGPYYENPEESRALFRRMRALRDEVRTWALPGIEMRFLSMGMSHDFPVAIEEGADFIRVGSAIFGSRP